MSERACRHCGRLLSDDTAARYWCDHCQREARLIPLNEGREFNGW